MRGPCCALCVISIPSSWMHLTFWLRPSTLSPQFLATPSQMKGGLCAHPQARGLAWRFFLGVVPDSAVGDEDACLRRLQEHREQYRRWKEELYPDFNKVTTLLDQ